MWRLCRLMIGVSNWLDSLTVGQKKIRHPWLSLNTTYFLCVLQVMHLLYLKTFWYPSYCTRCMTSYRTVLMHRQSSQISHNYPREVLWNTVTSSAVRPLTTPIARTLPLHEITATVHNITPWNISIANTITATVHRITPIEQCHNTHNHPHSRP